jgi:hypothetical protein
VEGIHDVQRKVIKRTRTELETVLVEESELRGREESRETEREPMSSQTPQDGQEGKSDF